MGPSAAAARVAALPPTPAPLPPLPLSVAASPFLHLAQLLQAPQRLRLAAEPAAGWSLPRQQRAAGARAPCAWL